MCLPGPSIVKLALRMNYAELRQKVNPSDIVAHLYMYAEGLISDYDRDDAGTNMHREGDRMDRLLPAVEPIRIDKSNFYIFLDIFPMYLRSDQLQPGEL